MFSSCATRLAARQSLLRPRRGGWRSFSASKSTTPTKLSKYEYPTRSEMPEIITTQAKDVISPDKVYPSISSSKAKPYIQEQGDPFDDAQTLSLQDQQASLQQQQQVVATDTTSSSSLTPITPEIPSFVPPNVPSQELQAPETIITQLDNGIRVVSQVRPVCLVFSLHYYHPASLSCGFQQRIETHLSPQTFLIPFVCV